MCGILGCVGLPLPVEERRHLVRRMGAWQAHRGPDAWGEHHDELVSLGQNRLSILDIEGGKQPMLTPDGRYAVVFNGEIYNFLELRRELAGAGYPLFTDHSDTEAVLWGFAHWGPAVFDRLEGMYAIAVWDRERRVLHLARDPLGIKPLYFARPARGLVFASEPKTIVRSGRVPAALDEDALSEYFLFRAPVHPRTMFRGVEKLEPGSSIAFDAETEALERKRFWYPRATALPARNARDLQDELDQRVRAAVRSHMIADVPVGVFLSGGVDSSLVAAFAGAERPLHAFTVTTDSALDEGPFARKVAAHTGLPISCLEVSAERFVDGFDEWCYHNDDPVADSSALALMLVARHAREAGMKVMLAGEGADELFGGYLSYRIYRAARMLRAVPLTFEMKRRAAQAVDFRLADYLASESPVGFWGTAHITDRATRARVLGSGRDVPDAAFAGLAELAALDAKRPVRNAMIVDQRLRLPNDVLPRTDRATMAVSLEARVPFLARPVVEFANGLREPDAMGGWRYQGKALLKRVAARYLPLDIIYRRKRGFDLPVRQWLSVELRPAVEHFLEARLLPGVSYPEIERRYRELQGGNRKLSDLIWAWLVLERWNESWVRGAIREPLASLGSGTVPP